MIEKIIMDSLGLMIISCFGAATLMLLTFAWEFFEDTELGKMFLDKLKERANNDTDQKN